MTVEVQKPVRRFEDDVEFLRHAITPDFIRTVPQFGTHGPRPGTLDSIMASTRVSFEGHAFVLTDEDRRQTPDHFLDAFLSGVHSNLAGCRPRFEYDQQAKRLHMTGDPTLLLIVAKPGATIKTQRTRVAGGPITFPIQNRFHLDDVTLHPIKPDKEKLEHEANNPPPGQKPNLVQLPAGRYGIEQEFLQTEATIHMAAQVVRKIQEIMRERAGQTP